jgi:hypothetical protein
MSQVLFTAEVPNRCRILFPTLVRAVTAMLPGRCSGETRFLAAYLVAFIASATLGLTALYAYLRLWFSQACSLIGILVTGISMLVAFGDGYFQPWSLHGAFPFCCKRSCPCQFVTIGR